MSRLGNLIGLAGYVWEHGGRLLVLLQSLPEGFRSASSGLVKAGDGAILVGRAFGGSSAEPPNAAELVESVKHAVEGCAAQVQAVARELRAVADAIDRVRVPAVTPVKEQFDLRVFGLGKRDLVTGITFGEQGPALFGDVSSSLRAQADSVEAGFGGQLRKVSEDLSGMSRALDGAGDGLTSLGNSLKEGGAALEPFSR
jgi:hypothetical protein